MKKFLSSGVKAFTAANKNLTTVGKGSSVVFASADKGRELITMQDDYISRLSDFDFKSKMQINRKASLEEFLQYMGSNTCEWTEESKRKVIKGINVFKEKTADLTLSLPEEIFFVRTTGQEEGGAAYTHANAIFLPEAFTEVPQKTIDWFVCHELFHVLTRANPELRNQLYEVIGFEKCDEIKLPEPVASHKISNPDAPINCHMIKIQVDGEEHWAAPVIYSDREFNTEDSQNFFQYLVLKLLLLEKGEGQGVSAVFNGQNPRLYAPEEVTGFFEQIGENTDYIIHPEEVLAENFVHMLMNTQGLNNPEITARMKKIIKDYGSKAALRLENKAHSPK